MTIPTRLHPYKIKEGVGGGGEMRGCAFAAPCAKSVSFLPWSSASKRHTTKSTQALSFLTNMGVAIGLPF